MKYEDFSKIYNEFYELIKQPLDLQNTTRLLEIIKAVKHEDEIAHGMEKNLLEAYIRDNINDPIAAKILEVKKINFSRWFA
jgi:hypothetical protein